MMRNIVFILAATSLHAPAGLASRGAERIAPRAQLKWIGLLCTYSEDQELTMLLGHLRPQAYATIAALAIATASAANAKGVALVQQSDGTVRTYSNVDMRMAGQTLTLRSADRKGMLRIASGACSFIQDVERCLPYAVTLTQNGKTHQIVISHGTIFLNLTNTAHHLPLSSDMLAPRTVLVLLKTAHGTYITAKGTLDEVKA
jgi:hypothetical protein